MRGLHSETSGWQGQHCPEGMITSWTEGVGRWRWRWSENDGEITMSPGKQFSMSSAGGVRLQIHRCFPFHSKICFGPSSLVRSDGQTWLSLRQINVERLFEGSESRRVWICGVTAMLLISHFTKNKYKE